MVTRALKTTFWGATLLLVALPAYGAGLVPCGDRGGPECDLGFLMGLGNNVIKFFLTIGVAYGVLMIAYGGFQLVISQGNESAMEKAKSRIWNVVIGFAIILLAYLVVNTVLKLLTGHGLTDWHL